MARGWHYAKLFLSNARRLYFSGMCTLLFLFLSLCRFCLFLFFFCSHWSLVDVPLIFFCPADHIPDWQPRVLLGMVEARSVNVKKTTTANNTVLQIGAPKKRMDNPQHSMISHCCSSFWRKNTLRLFSSTSAPFWQSRDYPFLAKHEIISEKAEPSGSTFCQSPPQGYSRDKELRSRDSIYDARELVRDHT